MAMLLVMLKMSPFATATGFTNVDKMFFDLKPRSIIDYMVIQAEIDSDHSFTEFLELTKWIRENTSRKSSFVSDGFSEMEFMQFTHFAP
ncbi:MAG: hypothetical protein QF877_19200, partial [Gammaproteobacteria bacterium]|nr:hypothetical protein [Gammaproteobacteria bacterium]